MSEDNLGPQPTPTSDEPEKFPGGADNLEDEEKYGDRGHLDQPVSPDLDPDKNPAIDDEDVPDEVQEGEDKQQEGEGGQGEDAGQEDEQGEPEEPA